MKKDLVTELRQKAEEYYEKAKIVITSTERANIEVADFGLDQIYEIGLESIVYINTDRVCAKEMVLLPKQTCPEHIHPPVGDYIGKEETFRCRYGKVYLYVDGELSEQIHAELPKGSEKYFTVFHEIVLEEGEQYTMFPGTKHWFQAGKDGAVVSEFSTHCYDEYDVFTDERIKRIPEIED